MAEGASPATESRRTEAIGVPAWSAVVVNYEYGSLLLEAVESLLADTSAGVPQIVVIDNGSSDGSVARLRAARPEIPVVDPGRNLGYAGAANVGIAHTTAPVVAVCNADLVVHAGTARAMTDRLSSDPGLGAVGPLILDPDGRVYPSARAQPSLRDALGHALLGAWRPENRFTRRYHQRDAATTVARDVDWVSGAAVWLRREALETVGGWDDGYFMYVEDLDLCWRLRRAGWRIAFDPAGCVTHIQGASTARRPVRMIVEHHRSSLRFAAKRWHGPRRVLLVPVALLLATRAAVLVALHCGASLRPARHRS